jgi:hypothetical protein
MDQPTSLPPITQLKPAQGAGIGVVQLGAVYVSPAVAVRYQMTPPLKESNVALAGFSSTAVHPL